MSQDVVGGSVASSTNEIATLSELTATPMTETQIRSAIARIDIQLLNITTGNGTYGGMEYEERGDTGFRIKTADNIRELRELRAAYIAALKDPVVLNDYEVLISKWDDPTI